MLRVVVVVEVEIVAFRVEATELVGEDEAPVSFAAFPALGNPFAVEFAGSRLEAAHAATAIG
jgi:hypothetical protein